MIVSHNTFTYLPPLDWWGWLLLPFTRCQTTPVQDQDFQVADIRLRYQDGMWWICHGKSRFIDFISGFSLLKSKGIKNIRLLFETQEEDEIMLKYSRLEEFLIREYPDFKFWTGRRKGDWRKLLDLPDLPGLYQHVGSMAGGWLGKICPWAWWKLSGEKKKKDIPESENIALDFL